MCREVVGENGASHAVHQKWRSGVQGYLSLHLNRLLPGQFVIVLDPFMTGESLLLVLRICVLGEELIQRELLLLLLKMGVLE